MIDNLSVYYVAGDEKPFGCDHLSIELESADPHYCAACGCGYGVVESFEFLTAEELVAHITQAVANLVKEKTS